MKLQSLPIMRLPNLIQLGKRLSLSTLIWLSLPTSIVKAQVTPDGSLESAVQQIQELMKINGGQRSGNNLFHSFEEFSIPAGMEAAFENATEIENIFTRVTGDSVSAIDGILSAQGGANLFLMNPNGIVFGTDASINVGGSFIATTADNIQFGDGQEFAASEAENDALINVRFPIAFGFNEEPGGSITVNGAGSQINRNPDIAQFIPYDQGNDSTGLSVKTGKTLALIGGKINIEGGKISAESGRIELGSVNNGDVKLSSTESGLNFDYEAVSNFKDINLSQKASADASGDGDGFIEVNGGNVRLDDGSVFLIQSRGNSSSGNISVSASQSLMLSGAASNQTVSSIASETLNNGSGANIEIDAQDLSLQDGGNIVAATFGAGKGGDINATISNSTQLFRTPDGIIERASSRIASLSNSTGDSGNISLSTSSLKASTGGTITSGPTGSGNGGSIDIKADLIELNGVTDKDGLFTAFVSGTFGTGNAGTLTIDTSTLKVSNGASVSTDSRNNSAAGNLTINASERVEVSGVDPNTSTSSTISSSVTLEENEAFRQAFSLPTTPNGKSGDLNIDTPNLNVDKTGNISVRNEGSGEAGILSINSGNASLNNSSSITATSASGSGGNINIDTDSLEIESNSEITATAGSEAGGGNININATNISAKKNSAISANALGGDGGNITIDTETLLGLQNSDITANAVEGDGGKITITSDVIVGFEERAELTELSDITASSEFGASGTITIDSPESSSDEELEVAAREADQNLARDFAESCSQGRGKFTYTAMGIPQNPDRYFDDSGEYGSEEVSDVVPNYPPIGFPQSEQQRRDTEKVRQNRLRQQQGQQQGQQQSPREVRGQMVVTDISPKTGKGYPIIYSETNTVPPRLNAWRKPGAPREEVNAIQINPNGEQYMVAIAEIEHPQDQVCTTTSNSAADR